MKKEKSNYCPDCESPRSSHLANWAEEILSPLLFFGRSKFASRFVDKYSDMIFAKIFGLFGLVSWEQDFDFSILSPRSQSFVTEARQNGCTIEILKSKFGYTTHLRLIKDNKKIYFDGLPTPHFIQKNHSSIFDDKHNGKKLLAKNNFPILPGKTFRFGQTRKALKFGQQLGFPLVVKPRNGSVARHVTTNILNVEQLKIAIKKSLEHSPTFLVEKFFENGFAHRVTIIDTEHIFIARQEPAFVIGDGINSIKKLIELKNQQPERTGNFLSPILFNDQSISLLQKNNLTKNSIPKLEQKIYLQQDPFIRLGGEFIDVTDQANKENIEMFLKVAQTFDLKILGLDFMSRDISKSWQDEFGAILEINSLPCLEIHEQVTSGQKQNLGKFVYQLIKKYYL